MRRYTVSALNEELGRQVEGRFGDLLVEGEVRQITTPRSGHRYLVLRDRESQLNAVIWRTNLGNLQHAPREGDRVLCRGSLGVFARRGMVQLYVTQVWRAGQGDMARRIRERRQRLERDGLLDPRRRRTLPSDPRVVGVATSLTGAALQDFLAVSRRRYPATRVLVAGCVVQGAEAAASVLRALELLIEDGRSQVVVITRGGGSSEDLLPFQDEWLARAIADCPVPVVTAVGHQVDRSLVDLVADAVAPTPSAAAELVLPDGAAELRRLQPVEARLGAALARGLHRRRQGVGQLASRLRSPGQRVNEHRRRLDELEGRLDATLLRRLRESRARARQADRRLDPAMGVVLRGGRERVARLDRLGPAVERRLARARLRWEAGVAQLDALSPLAVLTRGYAIARGPRGVLTRAADVAPGEPIELRLAEGSVLAEVVSRTVTETG